MRLSVVATCLCLCLIGFSSAQDAHASVRKLTNIPAEGLGPALNALAEDRNFQIVYVTEEIANVRTAGAIGEFTTEEALKQLLAGTGLTFRYLDDKTVTIESAITPHERSGHPSTTSSASAEPTVADQEGKKSSSGGFRVAQVDQGTARSSAVADTAPYSTNSQGGPLLSEIIVTANKRAENLQNIGAGISVVTAERLDELHANSLQDYLQEVPGVNLQSFGAPGYGSLEIRGISPQSVGSTVSTYIDNIPVGGSSAVGENASFLPDLDPADVQRVEVLKGPQGTLYGASSLGGVIKYVTKQPSLTQTEANITEEFEQVDHGDYGGKVRASFSSPLTDQVAVRVSGYYRWERPHGQFERAGAGITAERLQRGRSERDPSPSALVR
jgi:iron complex outermembrane recepter protein